MLAAPQRDPVQEAVQRDGLPAAIQAPPGWVLVSCDFSQVELRVAAALAGETSMIEAIIRGDDLHQLTADKLGISRDLAKTVNFLILYGGGPKKFAASSGLTFSIDSRKRSSCLPTAAAERPETP